MLIYNLSAWKQFFFISIEVTSFSSQLYFIFNKTLQDLNVCDVIIVAVQQKVPMATDIIP